VKLAFIWHSEFRTQELLNWQDGLWAALQELGKDWEVRIFVPYGDAQVRVGAVDIEQYPRPSQVLEAAKDWGPDAVLAWGGLDRPLHAAVRQLGKPTALCFAGGITKHPNLDCFDLIFVETDYHIDRIKHPNIRKAFGVNTDIFRPTQWQQPHFMAIMPAAFARYKRYDLFAQAFGTEGLAIGQVQTQRDGSVWEGNECHEVCLKYGVAVIPRITPYYMMPFMYGLAQATVLTSLTYGGGDRAVLESLACGKPVVVCADNEKLKLIAPEWATVAAPEYLAIRVATEQAIAEARPKAAMHNWVAENYSHLNYAAQLKEGIEGIL